MVKKTSKQHILEKVSSSWNPMLPQFRTYKKGIFHKAGLTGQFVYQIGELEALRTSSKEVPLANIPTKAFQKKITYLKQCLRKYRKLTGVGRGITAIQVGIPERFSVIYMPEVPGELLIIINPIVVKESNKFLLYPEMCMSANPIIAPVIRPSWVKFTYIDEWEKKHVWNKKDVMYNRVFQHEIDHMNGIINIDLVDSKKLILQSDPTYYEKAAFTQVTI